MFVPTISTLQHYTKTKNKCNNFVNSKSHILKSNYKKCNLLCKLKFDNSIIGKQIMLLFYVNQKLLLNIIY
nr:MAG TPA: hypothetical protein [Caudoviricetes sp.]